MAQPTEDEMNDELGKAFDNQGAYPGMSYTDGVRDTLQWVLGETEEAPLSEL